MELEYDKQKYPMIWKRVSRQGYCFTYRIPCRITRRVGKRIEIAASLVNGGERIHRVDQASLEHSPCECFSECRAIERALNALKVVTDLKGERNG